MDQAFSGSPTAVPKVQIDTIPEEAEEATGVSADGDTKKSIAEQNLYTFSGPPPQKGTMGQDLLGIKP